MNCSQIKQCCLGSFQFIAIKMQVTSRVDICYIVSVTSKPGSQISKPGSQISICFEQFVMFTVSSSDLLLAASLKFPIQRNTKYENLWEWIVPHIFTKRFLLNNLTFIYLSGSPIARVLVLEHLKSCFIVCLNYILYRSLHHKQNCSWQWYYSINKCCGKKGSKHEQCVWKARRKLNGKYVNLQTYYTHFLSFLNRKKEKKCVMCPNALFVRWWLIYVVYIVHIYCWYMCRLHTCMMQFMFRYYISHHTTLYSHLHWQQMARSWLPKHTHVCSVLIVTELQQLRQCLCAYSKVQLLVWL